MNASRSDRSVTAYVTAVALALGFLAVVSFMAYTVLRLRVTYELQSEFAVNKAEHQAILQDQQSFRTLITAWLDQLWNTVYGEVVPKVAEDAAKQPLRPSRIERFQENFNKDAKARLERLERRVMELERQYESLEERTGVDCVVGAVGARGVDGVRVSAQR